MGDENIRGNSAWASLERDRKEVAMGNYSTELTRTNSGSFSLTANVFEDSSRLDANAFLGPSAGWTDEKHRAYIQSLEASFVDQLHRSTCLYGLPSKRKPLSCNQKPAQCCNSSHQSIIVRNGHWKKESVQRVAHFLESTADSTGDFEKEQAQSNGGFVVQGNSTVCLARNPKRSALYGPSHEYSADDTAEVSDQNFVDEGLGKSGSLAVVAKRLKTVEVDASINDHVTLDVLHTSQDACVR